ncbi:MAG: hypothetical protein M3O30_05700 [Planctomycetota bacterium]|nr:hypothetical protein [Planctomycetota bacterium]
MWRMSMLVTKVKRDFGAIYSPQIIEDREASIHEILSDSRDSFIHGLLDDDPNRRWGNCGSMPVLITAVARRLGYPVSLVVAGRHVFARWDDGTTRFNIEASNPRGMSILPDEHFREKIQKFTPEEEKLGYFLRTLTDAEAFALFMQIRVECLIDTARYEETLLWSARSLQFAPTDPRFPAMAYYGLDLALRHRYRRKYPHRKIPPMEEAFDCQAGELLSLSERSSYLTIVAHHKEIKGEIESARQHYEDSCRQNFHGNNEQRDLQRFIRKYGPSKRTGPLLPPKNLGHPRRLKLFCKEYEEANVLRRLADRFEGEGELVKARDALYDLYMFDPADGEVFERARAFENRPQFQEQLKALIATARRNLQESGQLRKQSND